MRRAWKVYRHALNAVENNKTGYDAVIVSNLKFGAGLFFFVISLIPPGLPQVHTYICRRAIRILFVGCASANNNIFTESGCFGWLQRRRPTTWFALLARVLRNKVDSFLSCWHYVGLQSHLAERVFGQRDPFSLIECTLSVAYVLAMHVLNLMLCIRKRMLSFKMV
jgi:hypothetical protein